MSSSLPSPANTHAEILLRTMCGFILPLVQTASAQKTKDLNQILLEIKADEFVSALEGFISDMISRAQQGSKGGEISIESPLPSDGKSTAHRSANNKESPAPARGFINQSFAEHLAEARRVLSPRFYNTAFQLNDQDQMDMQIGLQVLQKYIAQEMPIRLLCFESHNSKLKITLKERGGIFAPLAAKFRADFVSSGKRLLQWSLHGWLSENTKYAILSHTWSQTPGELTYRDWSKGSLDAEDPKCQKLINFCKTAWEEHGLTFGWIDTVCIDKESSAELDESIRSMYTWYSKANICITYLAGTGTLSDMPSDPWFSRGWTLQELVAPQNRIKFYNVRWQQLKPSSSDDKQHPEILKIIRRATSITPDELRDIRRASISRRMQLAAKRKVTREEDTAYCLMGIFNVSISTEYGEGADRAFFRLVREIVNSIKDVSDIFNWGGERSLIFSQWTPITSLFPFSPSAYLRRSSNTQLRPWRPIKPLTLTHLGLRTPILLMPALIGPDLGSGRSHQPIGHYSATVSVAQPYDPSRQISCHLLAKMVTKLPGKTIRASETSTTFGILNVEAHGTSILVSKTCLAVWLEPDGGQLGLAISGGSYKRIYTEDPIVFDLQKHTNGPNDNEHKAYYQIERSQLEYHGIQLVTLYL